MTPRRRPRAAARRKKKSAPEPKSLAAKGSEALAAPAIQEGSKYEMNNSNNVPDGTDKPKDIGDLPLSDPAFDALFNAPQVADPAETDDHANQEQPEPRGTAFAPLPIGPYTEYGQTGKRNQVYGHCSQFCILGEDSRRRSSGLPVEEHGPWCESVSLGFVAGYGPDGTGFNAQASIKDLYTHGEYAPGVRVLRLDSRYISLEIFRGEDQRAELFLPVGEAFRLAAALEQLAREADRLNVPLAVA
ncbi:hypothetical protein AHiyo4_07730 [Arthrobacter sp. Hiyo4]|nr:hypothetical protein AHiyo4_07730 [Arthrobacter sp. Hiyo4]